MDKDFLSALGIEGEAADAVLSEADRKMDEIFGELSEEARNLRISIAAKEHGARDEQLLKLVIGDAPDIEAAVEAAEKSHGWLFSGTDLPMFSAETEMPSNSTDPFAHGAGLN